jgi:hypothetical protein
VHEPIIMVHEGPVDLQAAISRCGSIRRAPPQTPRHPRRGSAPRASLHPMSPKLKDVLRRAEAWPEWAQHDLAELALEIDQEVRAGTYHATREELRKIDEARASVRRGETATEAESRSGVRQTMPDVKALVHADSPAESRLPGVLKRQRRYRAARAGMITSSLRGTCSCKAAHELPEHHHDRAW